MSGQRSVIKETDSLPDGTAEASRDGQFVSSSAPDHKMSAVSGAILGDIYRWLMSNGFAVLKITQIDRRASGMGRISNRFNLNLVFSTQSLIYRYVKSCAREFG